MKSAFLLPALLHSICIFAVPAPYIITKYIEVSTYTYAGYTLSYATESASTKEDTIDVIPTATLVTDAISTNTDSTSYADVTVVEIILPSGGGKPSIISYDADSTASETNFVVPVTYKPYATCTGQNWTFVTEIDITLPTMVQSVLSYATITASETTYTDYYNKLVRSTAQVAVVNPSDIPVSDLAMVSSLYQPYYASYCYTPTTRCATPIGGGKASCTPTFAYDSGYRSSSGSSSSIYGSDGTCWEGDCWLKQLIIIAVCVPVGWLLLWILIGLWENWMSFKGIMLGKHRKRGMPYSWCCVSCLFLCWVGPTYKEKSVEEQTVLAGKWKEMKAGEKFKLWTKWGFRWKYPDMLGDEPEKDKRAFRQRCL